MSRPLLLALVMTACGGTGPDPAELPRNITCSGAIAGASCDVDGQWCASTNQCGLDVRYCKCTDGQFDCTEPYSPEEIQECTVVPEASCFLEGTGVCDQEPVGGGSCGCSNGAWVCQRSCDGCPSTLAVDGQACATQNVCRYSGTTPTSCTCVNGTFDCQ